MVRRRLDAVGSVVLADEGLDAELAVGVELLAGLLAGAALVGGLQVLVEHHAQVGGQVEQLQVLQVAVDADGTASVTG